MTPPRRGVRKSERISQVGGAQRESREAEAEGFPTVIRKVQDEPNDPGPRGSGDLQAECRKRLLAAGCCFYWNAGRS